MATGFQQRWKGKIAIAAAWFGGVQEFGVGSGFSGTDATVTKTIPASAGSASLTASTGIATAIWTLGAVPQPGQELEIALTTISSGIFIKAAAGTSFDPSTNTVMKSTYAQMITLYGLTTAKWAIKSLFPPPSTLIGGSGVTLTTTT